MLLIKSVPSCVKCQTEEERRSKSIDRELRNHARKMRRTQKIVLLGAGESGKSTFLKQMHIIHGEGFNNEAKLKYRTQIYENVLKGIGYLVNAKMELKINWSNTKSNEYVNEFKKLYDYIFRQYNTQNQVNEIKPSDFVQVVPFIKQLWFDEKALKEAYDRRREFPRYFVENVSYFMDSIDRLSNNNYIPPIPDILHCRRATTGIIETEIMINKVPFNFIDVGGQRTQRQRWQECFSDVTAILFLVSSSEYDEYLREDGQTNRLEESLKVFEVLVNYRHLSKVAFILFLNKHDLLIKKIQYCDIRRYFPDFNGNPRSITDVETYLQQKFTNLKKIENGINQPNSGFVERSSQRTAIFSHFTTAVDTNNIKTIFEIVRSMIFQQNIDAIMLN